MERKGRKAAVALETPHQTTAHGLSVWGRERSGSRSPGAEIGHRRSRFVALLAGCNGECVMQQGKRAWGARMRGMKGASFAGRGMYRQSEKKRTWGAKQSATGSTGTAVMAAAAVQVAGTSSWFKRYQNQSWVGAVKQTSRSSRQAWRVPGRGRTALSRTPRRKLSKKLGGSWTRGQRGRFGACGVDSATMAPFAATQRRR